MKRLKRLKPYVVVTWKTWVFGVGFDWDFRVYIGPFELVW